MGQFNSYTLATTASTSDLQLIWQGGQVKTFALPYSWDGSTLTLPNGGSLEGTWSYDRITGAHITTSGGKMTADVNGITVFPSYGIGWSPDNNLDSARDVNLLRDAAGVLALRNGTNPQALDTYN